MAIQRLTRNWLWLAGGVSLIGLHLALARISPEFQYGRDPLEQPILLLVGIQVCAGVVYLLAIRGMRSSPPGKWLLPWILGVGLALRISMLDSTPILADDHYRYLWDGAVVSEGVNPYAYAPEAVAPWEDSESVPGALRRLAGESGEVVSRINHAHLRTIYPPTAQGAFLVAHWLRPWSMVAWRAVLLGFDFAALILLGLIIRALGLPLAYLAVYWWNPLLVKETFNSGHMDLVALPFVLGAVWLAPRASRVGAAPLLALATGAKLWPAALLPVILRPMVSRPRHLVMAAGAFFVIIALMFLPVYSGGLGGDSGFTAYGRLWEMNDALYMLFLWGVKFLTKGSELSFGGTHLLTRVLVASLAVVWTAWLSRRPLAGAADLYERCLLIVAAIFLLSPTQYPWYYVWLLPFLAIRPRASLLLLTALLPLFYLRFWLAALDRVGLFDYGIVWLEYVPVWVLLVREFSLSRNARRLYPAEAPVR